MHRRRTLVRDIVHEILRILEIRLVAVHIFTIAFVRLFLGHVCAVRLYAQYKRFCSSLLPILLLYCVTMTVVGADNFVRTLYRQIG